MLRLRLSLCALALIVVPVLSSGTGSVYPEPDYTGKGKGSKSGTVGKPAPMPTSKPAPLPATKPTPLPNVCEFTDPKKAASFANVGLARFWDDVLKTDCTESAISVVFDAYFAPTVVYTVDGDVIATNLSELKVSVFFYAVVAVCGAPGTFLSWITLNATIDPVAKDVVTVETNRMISSPQGLCGYGFTYTGKVSGALCDDIKVFDIKAIGSLTLPSLIPCP
jgi:hypothetical protein